MSWLSKLFAKTPPPPPPPKRIPIPGEKWQLKPEDGPWASKLYPPVRILGVKDGWVLYDLLGNSSMRAAMFIALYDLVTPPASPPDQEPG